MDKVLQRSFHLKARGYLLDFLASVYPSYIVSGILAITAAVMLWPMLPHKQTALSTSNATVATPQPDSIVIAQEVAMAHLFGQSASSEPSTVPTVAVNIVVEGIIYSEDRASALAILKVDDNSAIFRIGDVLPDGEKLLSIAPTAIEIGTQGTPRVLAMQQDFGDGGGPLLAGVAGASGRNDFFPDMKAPQPSTYVPSLRPVLLSQNSDPLSQLRSLRQQLIPQQSPNKVVPQPKHPAKP